jgi:hypothetical protein
MNRQPYNWSWVGWCLLAWAILFYVVSNSIAQGYFTISVRGAECGFAHIKSSMLWVYDGQLLGTWLSPRFAFAAVLAVTVFGAGLFLRRRTRKEVDA